MLEKIINAFKNRFGADPDFVVRSPGRINLIGEHTDYNEGFVFPMAIKYAQWLAIKANKTDHVSLYSADIDKDVVFSVTDFSQKITGWACYPQGIAWALHDNGYPLKGWDGLLLGDLPLGAGLSSSAALDLVTARAFSLTGGFQWDPIQMSVISKQSENQWIGLNNGIMDQLISATGEKGKAILIDCRSLDIQPHALPTDTIIVVMNTMVKHALVESGYNDRFRQCMEGAKAFGKKFLRDVAMEEFNDGADRLDEVIRRRCRHVISENARTLEAAGCMERNDPVRLGQLMNESHASLRDDFEVSCEELDIMAEEGQKQPGCYGARMTGGGFGGSAIALVKTEYAELFMKNIASIYEAKTGIKPNIFATDAERGTSVEYTKD
ncbi:MAG TPA: galactokinase [Flexilinea sp.]|nr:galactokinase [Flexilinea sp.]